MVFTYDVSTDSGRVRLLISDTDTLTPANQLFQDEEIAAFLALENGNVRLAAAQALETMASTQVMVLKVITRGDISTNGAAVSQALLARADKLRKQNDEGSGDVSGMVDWAETVEDRFSWREQIRNETLRSLS